MRSVIRQSVILPAPAEALFDAYLSPSKHGAITGAAVMIGVDAGASFQAFDGVLTGTILVVISPRLIVQSWRSIEFGANDPDSTLILAFIPEGKQGRIDLVHLDVPDHDFDGVSKGWEKYYWVPWRQYLEDQ